MTNIGSEIVRLVGVFVLWIPRLVGAIFILIIGWIIAAVLRNVSQSALERMGLNKKVRQSPARNAIEKVTDNPSATVGNGVYWLILIITWTMVIQALHIPVLSKLVDHIYNYVPNILAALLILALALAASAFVSGLILRWMGDTPTGRIVSTIVPIVIMSISGFAILEQLHIAPIIVASTYIILLGSLGLGFAIAFGLGGRESAGRLLNSAYERGRQNIGRVREDINRGKERAKSEAEEKKDRMEDNL